MAEAENRQLEWYRESTKWLVAISGAAVVLGLGWVKDGDFGQVGKILLTIAGACLLLSCGSGILAVFKMADYESSRSKAAGLMGGEDSSPNGAKDKTNDGKQDKEKDRNAVNMWFHWSFTLFFIGLAALVVVGFLLVWREPAV